MRQVSTYRRLPGMGRTFGGYTRLYQADDHLLQTSTAMFTERYKRFYFRDIQAFIVLRTQGWVWELSLSSGIAFALILGTLFSTELVARAIMGGIAAVFVAYAVSVILRGPSCRCYVRTAVQTECVPSLNRMRRANALVARLRPLLDAAQDGIHSAEPAANPESSSQI